MLSHSFSGTGSAPLPTETTMLPSGAILTPVTSTPALATALTAAVTSRCLKVQGPRLRLGAAGVPCRPIEGDTQHGWSLAHRSLRPSTPIHHGPRGAGNRPFSGSRCMSDPTPSVPPEPFEPVGSQLGVPDGMLNVPVPEIRLQGARILPGIRERKATGVPQHVRVDL
jgi:hypothetical protein